MNYLVPSKTFLVGEYSVLVGGKALGIATNPCFRINYHSDQSEKSYFHELSPAGQYLKKNSLDLNISFEDPYKKKGVLGGFGRSTAEYLSVVIPSLLKKKKTIQQIRGEYLELFSDQAHPPSGVDLVFQYLGGLALVDSKKNVYRNLIWPFLDLDFFIISTGIKIATHDHLKNLDLNLIQDLPIYSDRVIEAFDQKDQQIFLNHMASWTAVLKEKNLIYKEAHDFKLNLENVKNILLVKPCGALGADVMIAFFNKKNKIELLEELKMRKINIHASLDDLAQGVVQYVG